MVAMANTANEDRVTSTSILYLLLIVALGALLRIFLLGSKDLSNDEAFTWIWINQSHAALWGAAGQLETNPPLFFSIEKMALHLFGYSEEGLRAVSVVAGVLTLPVVFLLGRLIGGTTTGLFAALLLALAPLHVAYSQEARGYSLLMLAGTTSIWGMLLFLKSHGGIYAAASPPNFRHRWLGLAAYAGATSIALYCHNTAALLPLLANVAALGWWAGRTRFDRRFAVEWVSANAVSLILWLWWLPVVAAQMQTSVNISWIRQPDLFSAIAGAARLYGMIDWYWIGPIPLLGALAVWHWRDRWPVVAILLAFVIGVPALTWSVGLVARPIWVERVILWPLGIGVVLFAGGILAVRSVALRAVTIALVAIILGLGLVRQYGLQDKPPYHQIVSDIADQFRSGDVIFHVPHFNAVPMAYYTKSVRILNGNLGIAVHAETPNRMDLLLPRLIGQELEYTTRATESQRLATQYARAWVVTRILASGDTSVRDELLGEFEKMGTLTWRRNYKPGIEVVLVTFDPPR